MWKLFLIIAIALLLLGVFSWLASYFKWFEKPRFIDPDSLQDEPQEEAEECCGQHEVCEKDLKTMARKDIVYYNDEELDAYVCDMNLDEDELAEYYRSDSKKCAYYRYYDEYKTVQKQI